MPIFRLFGTLKKNLKAKIAPAEKDKVDMEQILNSFPVISIIYWIFTANKDFEIIIQLLKGLFFLSSLWVESML